jgi:Dolichyl-phosphate-mannose-protein mannosyltransferase
MHRLFRDNKRALRSFRSVAPDFNALNGRAWQLLAILIVLIGILLRVRQYLANMCFWIDECFLALNIMNRGACMLVKPLDLNQASPLLFLFSQKLVISLFGPTEFSFRLLPLLAGCLSVEIFRRLAWRVLTPPLACLALAFFALSDPLIYHSAEAKQYIIDVLMATLLLFYGTQSVQQTLGWAEATRLGCVGVLAILSSFASPLVLVGIGLGVLSAAPRQRCPKAAVVASVWVTIFGIYYVAVLRHVDGNGFLRNYWSFAFPPLTPVADTCKWFLDRGFEFVDLLVLRQYFGILSIVLVILGAIDIVRRQPSLGLVFLLPVASAVVVAGLRLYPLQGRLALYVAPIVIITLVRGLDTLRNCLGWLPTALLAVMLLLSPALKAGRFAIAPRERCEVRKLFNHVRANARETDLVYIAWHPSILYEYYRAKDGRFPAEVVHQGQAPDGNMANASHGETLRHRLHRLPRVSRLWVLYAATVDVDVDTTALRSPIDQEVKKEVSQCPAVLEQTYFDRGAALEIYKPR